MAPIRVFRHKAELKKHLEFFEKIWGVHVARWDRLIMPELLNTRVSRLREEIWPHDSLPEPVQGRIYREKILEHLRELQVPDILVPRRTGTCSFVIRSRGLKRGWGLGGIRIEQQPLKKAPLWAIMRDRTQVRITRQEDGNVFLTFHIPDNKRRFGEPFLKFRVDSNTGKIVGLAE